MNTTPSTADVACPECGSRDLGTWVQMQVCYVVLGVYPDGVPVTGERLAEDLAFDQQSPYFECRDCGFEGEEVDAA